MPGTQTPRSALLTADQVRSLPENRFVHQLNPEAIRLTRSLGDATGLVSLGVHLVRLTQGHESTEYHFHHQDEEWIYILAGRGTTVIGGEEHEVGPGDFMGFVAGSAPHSLKNSNAEDLVYLVGGNRLPFDVCDYPRLRKRRYRVNGEAEYVDWDKLEKRTAPR
jgi:uncharacterized cupin superfamily protein